MPTGQPDPRFRFLIQERGDAGGCVAEDDGEGTPFSSNQAESSLPGRETQQDYATPVDVLRGRAERLIQEAMDGGEFDDLPGTGQPIPGAGTVDDELWWIRSWFQRNQEQE